MDDLTTLNFPGFAKPLSKLGLGSYEEWAPGKKLKLLLVGYNDAINTANNPFSSSIYEKIHSVCKIIVCVKK